jgi:tRNA splicing endonuclease
MSSSPSCPNPSSHYEDDDFQYIVEAVLAGRGLKILVTETRFQDQLRNKGFGEKEDSEYILKPYEALYLIHTKILLLKSKKDVLDFDSITELIL